MIFIGTLFCNLHKQAESDGRRTPRLVLLRQYWRRGRNLFGKGETSPIFDFFFDCGWSLLNHDVAQRKRLNLGDLNPIYERVLNPIYERLPAGYTHVTRGRFHALKYGCRKLKLSLQAIDRPTEQPEAGPGLRSRTTFASRG